MSLMGNPRMNWEIPMLFVDEYVRNLKIIINAKAPVKKSQSSIALVVPDAKNHYMHQ